MMRIVALLLVALCSACGVFGLAESSREDVSTEEICAEKPDHPRCVDQSDAGDASETPDAAADAEIEAGLDAHIDSGSDAHVDAAMDASDASDARADTGPVCMCAADGGKPICLESTKQCVECTGAQHCGLQKPVCSSTQCVGCTMKSECSARPDTPSCNMTTGACVECTSGDPAKCTAAGKVCKTGGTSCVECNQDADCPTAGKAKCDLTSNTCVPCDGNAQCAHVSVSGNSDLDVCNAGICVQCTPATEAAECGANACNPDSFTCTSKARGTVAACGACNADSECFADHKCIKVPFMATAGDYRCMKLVSATCANPYGGPVLTVPSKNGLPAAAYCSHNTGVTSCDAITALTSGKACTAATVSQDCGQGARCETVGGIPNRCTYACDGDPVCPISQPCNEQNSPNPYCGGP